FILIKPGVKVFNIELMSNEFKPFCGRFAKITFRCSNNATIGMSASFYCPCEWLFLRKHWLLDLMTRRAYIKIIIGASFLAFLVAWFYRKTGFYRKADLDTLVDKRDLI